MHRYLNLHGSGQAETLRGDRVLGARRPFSVCLAGLAEFAVRHGDAERAARLLGAAEGILQELGYVIPAVYSIDHPTA